MVIEKYKALETMSVLIDLFVKKHGKVKNLDYVVGQVCLVLYKNKHFHKI